MSKLARLAATALIAVITAGGAVAAPASAATSPTYTCSNQGSGTEHIVNCSGPIAVDPLHILPDVKVDISVKDVNVLTEAQLIALQAELAKIYAEDSLLSITLQLTNLQTVVVKTYLADLHVTLLPLNVKVCVGSTCV